MLDLWRNRTSVKGLPQRTGKRAGRSLCAGSSSGWGVTALPVINGVVGKRSARVLVDTGCSKSVVGSWMIGDFGAWKGTIVGVDGHEVSCLGYTIVPIEVDGLTVEVDCVVMERLIEGVDVVLGMDFIQAVGGLQWKQGKVRFLKDRADERQLTLSRKVQVAASQAKPVLTVEDKDFEARFDGRSWTVKWRWRDGQPPVLINEVDCYRSTKTEQAKEKLEEEVKNWIEKGWMKRCEDQSDRKGILSLMAVIQANKDKVRPVLDYRELNMYVESHPGVDVAVCTETLRKWRRLPGRLKLVDLKSAYLQIQVEKSLWPYQRVNFDGVLYYLTRLGFGLNSAPKIMTKILNEVLAQDEHVRKGTDSYIDDIIVNEEIVSAEEVVKHLACYGLETKAPEGLDGGRVLGLALTRDRNDRLSFGRGNTLPDLVGVESLTRRELFSACGKIVGHYPVCGWLRVACSFIKRVSEGERWDDSVGESAMDMIRELLTRIEAEDPVRGVFHVAPCKNGRVWCDASSLALGVAVEIGGQIVEDAAWLRKRGDSGHINVAELDAVVKGVNLALKWDLQLVEIMTDSMTVLRWLKTILDDENRVRVTGLSEMLVRRRLSILRDLVRELGVVLTVTFTPSEKNRADVLTRVPKVWLGEVEVVSVVDIEGLHSRHHFGVDRTLYLTRLLDPSVKRKSVESVVKSCRQCQTIDPAPSSHVPGELSVSDNWVRLALDVTHFRGRMYLTVVDCGPSRFALWREVASENAREICGHMTQIFLERGPPDEVLMDNSTAFRSFQFADVCREWNITQRFRAAYRPSGNGIAERIHRTIKSMAARSEESPLKMVFWYNLAAREGVDGETSPAQVLHRYSWRHPSLRREEEQSEGHSKFSVGDPVVVKPADRRCTSRWTDGKVTGIKSENTVEVDGVPRHVLDIRRLFLDEESDEECPDDVEDVRTPDVQEAPRCTGRTRRPPLWLSDYEC